MKKLVITLSVSMLFFACKKDYTCECTATPGNTTSKITILNTTKARAKARCVSTSYEVTVGGTTTKYENNCSLK